MSILFILLALTLPILGITFLIYRTKLAKKYQSPSQVNQQGQDSRLVKFLMAIIILLLSIVIFFGIRWFPNNKKAIEFNTSYDSLHTNRRMAYNDWNSIIIGKWKITDILKQPEYKEEKVGIIEFNIDSSYVSYLTMKHYKYNSTAYDSYPFRIFGGRERGKWKVRDKMLMLDVTECDFSMSYTRDITDKYNPCEYMGYDFGEFNDSNTISSIIQFNQDSMQFHEKYYSSDGEDDIIFTRAK